jgi:serine/threonine-protein kinase
MADRRELPAVLRAFVKRTGRLDGGGTVLTLLGALGLAIVVASWLGPLPGVVTLLVSMVLAPVLYAVYAARQFLLQGFAHADLAPAFASELEVLREEWSVQPRRGVAILEWGARSAARVLATTTIALTPLAVLGNWLPRFEPVTPLVLLFAAAAAAATIAWLALLQLRREVDLSFWRAVWTGRFGETVFAVARRFRGRAVVVPAMTHRATELSLSLAAEQLFESLPREAKHALGDMPAVLQRLQRDAHQLRTRLAQLQEILAVRREETVDDAGRTAIERERTRVRAQLQETVAALETLRLGLLRLHAGAMSIEGLTTHLDVAAALSDDVMRLAAAHDDVEQMLRHDAVPTPV